MTLNHSPRKPRWFIVVFVAMAMSCGHRTATVIIANGAAQPVEQITVTVCGQRLEAAHLLPGATETRTFLVSCEGGYVIDARMQSGRQIHAVDGYVTSGIDFRHRLTVTNDGVTFTSDAP